MATDVDFLVALLQDVWPTGVSPADYPRAVRLVLRMAGPQRPGIMVTPARAPTKPAAPATRVARTPRPRSNGNGRRPGRPAKGTPALREEVLALLSDKPGQLHVSDIATTLKSPASSIYTATQKLVADSTIVRNPDGTFSPSQAGEVAD